MRGIKGYSLFLHQVEKFYVLGQSGNELLDTVRKSIEMGDMHPYLSKVAEGIAANIDGGLLFDEDPIELRLKLLHRLGFVCSEAERILNVNNVFRGGGSLGRGRALYFDEAIMLAAFLEASPYPLLGSDSTAREYPWYYHVSGLHVVNSSWTFGYYELDGVPCGITYLCARGFSQTSIVTNKLLPTWEGLYPHVCGVLGHPIHSDVIYCSGRPACGAGGIVIHRFITRDVDAGKLDQCFILNRALATSSIYVGYGGVAYSPKRHPREVIHLVDVWSRHVPV